MSDGTTRKVELTPMVHQGMPVVRFKDNNSMTYMGLNGLTLNGKLLVTLSDRKTAQERLKEEGWK